MKRFIKIKYIFKNALGDNWCDDLSHSLHNGMFSVIILIVIKLIVSIPSFIGLFAFILGVIMLSVIMLSIVMLNFIMLSGILLILITLSVIMVNVIMLLAIIKSVVALVSSAIN